MDRRRFIAISATTATTALAGCVFGDSEELSAELEDGESESFEAEEGDEYEVTVEVTDGDEAGVEVSYNLEESSEDVESEEEGMEALGEAYSGPLVDETVEDEETFEIEIEADGHYDVAVTDGAAEVTVE